MQTARVIYLTHINEHKHTDARVIHLAHANTNNKENQRHTFSY